jgi:hypothetical protein
MLCITRRPLVKQTLFGVSEVTPSERAASHWPPAALRQGLAYASNACKSGCVPGHRPDSDTG